jgi:hypothetical protein
MTTIGNEMALYSLILTWYKFRPTAQKLRITAPMPKIAVPPSVRHASARFIKKLQQVQ